MQRTAKKERNNIRCIKTKREFENREQTMYSEIQFNVKWSIVSFYCYRYRIKKNWLKRIVIENVMFNYSSIIDNDIIIPERMVYFFHQFIDLMPNKSSTVITIIA